MVEIRTNIINLNQRNINNETEIFEDSKTKLDTHVEWKVDSWKKFKISQQPKYSNSIALNEILKSIKQQNKGVTDYNKIDNLNKELENYEEKFLLISGDCSEPIEDKNKDVVNKKLAFLHCLGHILAKKYDKKVILLGRIAGQYAKPRSSDFETIDEVIYPTYRGDIVNDFNYSNRSPDPLRLLKGLEASREVKVHINDWNRYHENQISASSSYFKVNKGYNKCKENFAEKYSELNSLEEKEIQYNKLDWLKELKALYNNIDNHLNEVMYSIEMKKSKNQCSNGKNGSNSSSSKNINETEIECSNYSNLKSLENNGNSAPRTSDVTISNDVSICKEIETQVKISKITKITSINDDFSNTLNHLNISKLSEIYTCHEGLLLNYEESLTSLNEDNNKHYCLSAEMLWIGERTNSIDEAHVEFFRGIANPIGIKVSSKTSPEEIIALIKMLNPLNIKGKIIFISRVGNTIKGKSYLQTVIPMVKKEGLHCIFVIDPMHGNTEMINGHKSRQVWNIIQEINFTLDILRDNGLCMGGLHFEATPFDVTECVMDKSGEIEVEKYTTRCDPRLNLYQAIEVVKNIKDL